MHIFSTSANKDGAVAKRRGKRKRIKFIDETLPGGLQSSSNSLLLEHFERWGEEGRKYLQTLDKKSPDKAGRFNSVEFTSFQQKHYNCNSRGDAKKDGRVEP